MTLLIWLILQTATPTMPMVRVDIANDSPPFLVDAQGKLLFDCRKCPNKMCKHLACSGALADGKFIWNCECVRDKKWTSPTATSSGLPPKCSNP